MTDMAKKPIPVRMDAEKVAALDALSTVTDRDRSWLINDAVDAYLAVHRWQIAHIEEGVRQADAGEFATDAEVSAAFARWQ
jgi:RHH-type rel operon transcriptional repressor/antitoxin RelB